MPVALARSSIYLPRLREFAGPALFLLSTPAAQMLTVYQPLLRKLQALVTRLKKEKKKKSFFVFLKISQALCGNICPKVGQHCSIFGTYSAGRVELVLL